MTWTKRAMEGAGGKAPGSRGKQAQHEFREHFHFCEQLLTDSKSSHAVLRAFLSSKPSEITLSLLA